MSLSDSEYVTIDKDIRNTGFFSEYLPPCFQLNPKAFLQPPPFECDLIPPYNFNMSRFNQNDARRIISIPEIGAYAVVHAYLFTILTNNARSLTKACSLILKSTTYEPLNEKEKAQISTMLLMNLLEDHDLEVLWLLYILIEAQALVPNDSAINKIIESQNELAQIMLLRKNFLSDAQKQTISEKAHSWILLYELFSNDIISEESLVRKLNLNKNLNMYRKMKDNDVHFCY